MNGEAILKCPDCFAPTRETPGYICEEHRALGAVLIYGHKEVGWTREQFEKKFGYCPIIETVS